MVVVNHRGRPFPTTKSGLGARPVRTQRSPVASLTPAILAMPFPPTRPPGRRGPAGRNGPHGRVARLTSPCGKPYWVAMAAMVCPAWRACTHSCTTTSAGKGPASAVYRLTSWCATPSRRAMSLTRSPRRRASTHRCVRSSRAVLAVIVRPRCRDAAGNGPYGAVARLTVSGLTPSRHAISAIDSPSRRRESHSSDRYAPPMRKLQQGSARTTTGEQGAGTNRPALHVGIGRYGAAMNGWQYNAPQWDPERDGDEELGPRGRRRRLAHLARNHGDLDRHQRTPRPDLVTAPTLPAPVLRARPRRHLR